MSGSYDAEGSPPPGLTTDPEELNEIISKLQQPGSFALQYHGLFAKLLIPELQQPEVYQRIVKKYNVAADAFARLDECCDVHVGSSVKLSEDLREGQRLSPADEHRGTMQRRLLMEIIGVQIGKLTIQQTSNEKFAKWYKHIIVVLAELFDALRSGEGPPEPGSRAEVGTVASIGYARSSRLPNMAAVPYAGLSLKHAYQVKADGSRGRKMRLRVPAGSSQETVNAMFGFRAEEDDETEDEDLVAEDGADDLD